MFGHLKEILLAPCTRIPPDDGLKMTRMLYAAGRIPRRSMTGVFHH